MIIAKGKIYDTKQQDDILEHLEDEIIQSTSQFIEKNVKI